MSAPTPGMEVEPHLVISSLQGQVASQALEIAKRDAIIATLNDRIDKIITDFASATADRVDSKSEGFTEEKISG